MFVDTLMESFPQRWTLYGTGVLVGAATAYAYLTWHHGTMEKYGLHGPKPHLLGRNMPDAVSMPHFGSIDILCRENYGKTYVLYEGRIPSISSQDTSFIKEMCIKQFGNFINRRKLYGRGLMRHSVFDARDEKWQRIRHQLSAFFSGAKMRHHLVMVNRCTDVLVTHLDQYVQSGEAFLIKDVIAAYAMDIVAATAFGLDIDSLSNKDHPFIKAAKGALLIKLYSPILLIPFIFPFLGPIVDWSGMTMFERGCIEYLEKVTKDIIKRRKEDQTSGYDLVKILVTAEEFDAEGVDKNHPRQGSRRGMTAEEVTAQGVIFIMAGYDTTSTVIEFLLLMLAQHADWQDKVYQEIVETFGEDGTPTYDKLKNLKYLDMCMEETLRIYPPAFKVDREASADTVIQNIPIRKGSMVTVPIYAIHHDPENYPEPDKFDPERFLPEMKSARDPYTYIPFGVGPRICLGMRLAQVVVKVAVARIIHKYKVVLDEKTKIPITLKRYEMFPKVEGGTWLRLVARN